MCSNTCIKKTIFSLPLSYKILTVLLKKKKFQINIHKTVCKVEKQERHHSEPEHSKEMKCLSAQENLLRCHASPMLHRANFKGLGFENKLSHYKVSLQLVSKILSPLLDFNSEPLSSLMLWWMYCSL